MATHAHAAPGPGADGPPGASLPASLVDTARVDLVLVPVSVHGPDHAPVRQLKAQDFTLWDGDARRAIATFDAEPTPASVLLGIDCSGSMRHLLPIVQAGAVRFVRRLPAAFEVLVAGFDNELFPRGGFTAQRGTLYHDIERLRPTDGGTALIESCAAAVELLRDRPGRRVAVLFTDGIETSLPPAEAEDAAGRLATEARRAAATLYFIGYGAGSRSRLLRRLAEATGGGLLPCDGRISRSFEELARSLNTTYTLGFHPPAGLRPGEWRPLRVEVHLPGATVTARPGYFMEAEPARR